MIEVVRHLLRTQPSVADNDSSVSTTNVSVKTLHSQYVPLADAIALACIVPSTDLVT